MSHSSPRRRKALGQHFLVDDNIADRIVAAAEIAPGERILEIGPGRGVLTERLAPLGKLVAVEKDRWLAAVQRQRFGDELTLIEGDALDVDLPQVDVVVANLPYAISSPLLFRLFDVEWGRAVLMFQEEFARRLAASPGSKAYGRLSVMAQHHVDCRKLFRVSRTAFLPQPRVHSLVVRLERRAPDYEVRDFAIFKRVVATLFQHRRKTVRNALRLEFPADAVEQLPHLQERGEVLTPAQMAGLADLLSG
ncbi:MAG: 16S rRNA (adenine(1518)-N(6)/adenine(1519)-N(6))-dimethyltransferase RsmA [Candidatus Poseidoniia archaeon]|nr:16S rRNA (adenine(1518)-N(6)/adenine(1519)-N(6))-dimethyltransferase RsmA [Candidatus Poseidoniia archaeon]